MKGLYPVLRDTEVQVDNINKLIFCELNLHWALILAHLFFLSLRHTSIMGD